MRVAVDVRPHRSRVSRNIAERTSSNAPTTKQVSAGGGLSYAVTNNLVATIEGLYVSFERNRDNTAGFLLSGNVVGVSNTGAPIVANQLGFDNRRNRDDFAVVRAKLDWKFGSLFGL